MRTQTPTLTPSMPDMEPHRVSCLSLSYRPAAEKMITALWLGDARAPP